MKRHLFTLLAFSTVGLFTLTNCGAENQEGTDSFERSMNDGKFNKKDRNQSNDTSNIGEFEKNYPGDSI